MKHAPKPPELSWATMYAMRTARLQGFLAKNAPEVIIESECRLVLRSIARSRHGYVTCFRWLKHDLSIWWDAAKMRSRWAWKRRMRGWTEEKCREHFLGFTKDPEEIDPALAELNKIFNAGKGKAKS